MSENTPTDLIITLLPVFSNSIYLITTVLILISTSIGAICCCCSRGYKKQKIAYRIAGIMILFILPVLTVLEPFIRLSSVICAIVNLQVAPLIHNILFFLGDYILFFSITSYLTIWVTIIAIKTRTVFPKDWICPILILAQFLISVILNVCFFVLRATVNISQTFVNVAFYSNFMTFLVFSFALPIGAFVFSIPSVILFYFVRKSQLIRKKQGIYVIIQAFAVIFLMVFFGQYSGQEIANIIDVSISHISEELLGHCLRFAFSLVVWIWWTIILLSANIETFALNYVLGIEISGEVYPWENEIKNLQKLPQDQPQVVDQPDDVVLPPITSSSLEKYGYGYN